MSSKSTPIYTLRIELQDVEPLVWRRVQVPANITLPKLHRVIQAAMGWTNSHLHSFRVGEHDYAQPDELEELDFIDEKGVKLDSLIGDSIDAFSYQYDFGDSWHHQIIVESKGKGKPGWSYPLCIGGQRACPPEDVGGASGYQEFAEALRDPHHAEHESYLTWVGGFFDPEGFDGNAVNDRLRQWQL